MSAHLPPLPPPYGLRLWGHRSLPPRVPQPTLLWGLVMGLLLSTTPCPLPHTITFLWCLVVGLLLTASPRVHRHPSPVPSSHCHLPVGFGSGVTAHCHHLCVPHLTPTHTAMGFGYGITAQHHPCITSTPSYGVWGHRSLPPPCPCSVPEAAVPLPPPGPSLRGPQLGAQPLTRTRRAAALRDTEDEIFTL